MRALAVTHPHMRSACSSQATFEHGAQHDIQLSRQLVFAHHCVPRLGPAGGNEGDGSMQGPGGSRARTVKLRIAAVLTPHDTAA
jgi:hypothetical protein